MRPEQSACYTPPSISPAPADLKPDAAHIILTRFLCAGRLKSGSINSTPAGFRIDASLPKLGKHGIMHGVRTITESGAVVFSDLIFAGDDLIRTAVINRFLTSQSRQRTETEDLRISEQNYRFSYKGTCPYNDRTAIVFRLDPRRRRFGLFKGELWLDAEAALPLRQWGEFVKSPSVFVGRIYFVYDYWLNGAESRPRRIIVKLRTVLAGTAELTMWFDGQPDAR